MSKKSRRSSKKKRARSKKRAQNRHAQSVKQNPATSWFNTVSSSPARLWGWIAGIIVVFLVAVVIFWFALGQGGPVVPTPTAWPTVAAP